MIAEIIQTKRIATFLPVTRDSFAAQMPFAFLSDGDAMVMLTALTIRMKLIAVSCLLCVASPLFSFPDSADDLIHQPSSSCFMTRCVNHVETDWWGPADL